MIEYAKGYENTSLLIYEVLLTWFISCIKLIILMLRSKLLQTDMCFNYAKHTSILSLISVMKKIHDELRSHSFSFFHTIVKTCVWYWWILSVDRTGLFGFASNLLILILWLISFVSTPIIFITQRCEMPLIT